MTRINLRQKLETRFPDENWAWVDDDTPFYYFKGQHRINADKWPSGLPDWGSDEILAFLQGE